MPKGNFDADQKVKDLTGATVTIGEATFHPARLTPDVRRDQLTVAMSNAKLAGASGLSREMGPDATDEDVDQRVSTITQIDEGLYKQLAILLRDEQGNQPPVEFLSQHLDNRVASEMLSWLLDDEEDDPGEPTPSASTS